VAGLGGMRQCWLFFIIHLSAFSFCQGALTVLASRIFFDIDSTSAGCSLDKVST